MKSSLKNHNILVGIAGGIAAYKACSLINLLIQEGADVRVVMTEAAKKFVTPLTFQTLTNHTVYSDMFDIHDQNVVEHIWLAKWPHVFVLAPATASTIAKLAHGFADNLLTTIVLALPIKTKVVVAPAMNIEMWNNSFVQNNIEHLKSDKRFIIVNPRSGVLACRDEGIGKLAEISNIVAQLRKAISK
jgi:phosphopantothenoylcysteine decarboxylase / phosphopantothenate---cysteine ligase